MTQEQIELILTGTIEMIMLVGFICWLISMGQDIKNTEIIANKKIKLLDTKILKLENEIKKQNFKKWKLKF